MKKHLMIGLIVLLLGLTIIATGYRTATANVKGIDQAGVFSEINHQAAPTLLPTAPPVYLAGYPTPEPRVLPPVGSNAGLVIGASVLVLIIIGGVLSARLRSKH